MPASRPLDELRKQAAELIIRRLRDSSVADVAKDLGISRQAVYDIRKGKYCPSLALIQKACVEWGVRFNYRGVRIDSGSFGAREKVPSAGTAEQMSLLESLARLDASSFEVVQTKPVGRALEITLRLTVPDKKTASG